jgi:hypothetical protein
MNVARFTLVIVIAAITMAPSQAARPALAVAFLYDLTNSAVPLVKRVPDDRQLEDATGCLVAEITSTDTLRFGFITSHLYLSRPYAASEMPDFYRKVVRPTVVSPDNRVGPSPIWDAIDKTISSMTTDSGRRAVIVMTDGLSTGNVHSMSEVVNHANTVGVSISGIYAGNPFALWKEWPVHAGERLSAIAADTGGLYVVPNGEDYREARQTSPVSKRNLNKAVEQIFEKLRH